MKNPLVSTILVKQPIAKVWNHWTNTDSIKLWNVPFEDWHCPKAENNAITGGTFFYRMENKNTNEGFDYYGNYEKIIPLESIESICDDGRKNKVQFEVVDDNNTIITETFEPDSITPLDIHQNFTDSILEKFKEFVENI